MALIAVLWIVAALSIAVMGITSTVKSETRVVASARRMAEARADGEAAIMLVMQQMAAPQAGGARPPQQRFEVSFDGRVIAVEANALNGLVDINGASPELLAALFSAAGGLGGPAATALAQATVQARQQPDASGQAQKFEATEDLMRVPGVDYDLYARLRPLITTDARGSGKINPQAAPQELLSMLGGGGTSILRGDFIDNVVGSRYRMQATVPMIDGSQGVVLCDVDLNPDTRAGLPWRIFGTETWMQAQPAKDV
jgi:general secretion pathway protein K